MMLEIVDEAEAEQDQKKATAATQEPGEASAERSEFGTSPVPREPSRNRASVEPAPESTPAEVKNDIDADTARRPLYKPEVTVR